MANSSTQYAIRPSVCVPLLPGVVARIERHPVCKVVRLGKAGCDHDLTSDYRGRSVARDGYRFGWIIQSPIISDSLA